MQRSSLVELIEILEPEECQEFDQFLANDGARPAESLRLFRYVLLAIQKSDADALDKKQVYQAIFSENPPVKGKLEKLMAELNKQLRQFLQTRNYFLPENDFRTIFDLAEMYRKRGLQERYFHLLKKLNAMQANTRRKSTAYFFRQFQLEYSLHENQSIYNKKKGDVNIPAVLRNLDIYYHLNRLDLLNYFLLQSKMANLELSEEIQFALRETTLPQRYLNASSVLNITFHIFKLLQSESVQPADFQKIANLLKKHESEIEPEKRDQFYTYLRNLCVIMINAGLEDFWQTLHEIQRDNLQRGLLYHAEHKGKLTPSTFLNLVSVALHVGQAQWVDAFLQSHQDRIIGDNETYDFFRLNQACHLFAQGKYDEALDHIPASSPYLDYQLMARRLEIKIYYELKSDLLSYKLDAFKMLISRMSKKHLSDRLRRRNANFANLLLQIIQTAPGDKKRSKKVLLRIQARQDIVERVWLLEKAKSML